MPYCLAAGNKHEGSDFGRDLRKYNLDLERQMIRLIRRALSSPFAGRSQASLLIPQGCTTGRRTGFCPLSKPSA